MHKDQGFKVISGSRMSPRAERYYSAELLRQRGLAALAAEPDERKQRPGWAVVGSVHSVKGGEAD